jgi:hypothetical protein
MAPRYDRTKRTKIALIPQVVVHGRVGRLVEGTPRGRIAGRLRTLRRWDATPAKARRPIGHRQTLPTLPTLRGRHRRDPTATNAAPDGPTAVKRGPRLRHRHPYQLRSPRTTKRRCPALSARHYQPSLMAPVARHTIATDLGEPTFRPVNRVGWPPNGWPISRSQGTQHQ